MNVLRLMLENLTSKPCTILYPEEKVPVPKAFRGRVVIIEEKCIGCARCTKVCPSSCIAMVDDQQEVEFRGKKVDRKKRPTIHLIGCLRCGLCEQYCPSDAIFLKDELSYAGTNCDVVVR